MKVGNKVRIKVPIYPLRNRKNKNGVITNIDGQYILVRPMWCNWETELYPCELEVLK